MWSLMKLMTPFVIRLPAASIEKDDVKRIRDDLEWRVNRRTVEVWLQKYQENGVWMRNVTSDERFSIGQSDDVFLFAYVAPWENHEICAGIQFAAELGREYLHGSHRGPGWFAG